MIRPAIIFSILFGASVLAQDKSPPVPEQRVPLSLASPTPVPTAKPKTTTTLQKRGFFGRVMHPFSSSDVLPKYSDKKLRGLVLDLQVSPQPVRLSEVRQMEVKLTVNNMGTHMIQLDFPTDQRIEVQLLNAADAILSKWSENHAIMERPCRVQVSLGGTAE